MRKTIELTGNGESDEYKSNFNIPKRLDPIIGSFDY